MITAIELDQGNLSTMYTLVGQMYPRSDLEPNGYTHIRILKNGKARSAGGALYGEDTPMTPSPFAKHISDLHFSIRKRNFTIKHSSSSSTTGLSLEYTTPLKLKPGLYELQSKSIKNQIKNARLRSYNAMDSVGVKPETWKSANEELFYDSENNVLSYRLIVKSRMISELKKMIKKHEVQGNRRPENQPSPIPPPKFE